MPPLVVTRIKQLLIFRHEVWVNNNTERQQFRSHWDSNPGHMVQRQATHLLISQYNPNQLAQLLIKQHVPIYVPTLKDLPQ